MNDFRLNTAVLASLRGSDTIYKIAKKSGIQQGRLAGIFDGRITNITIETLYRLLRLGLGVSDADWSAVVGQVLQI